MVIVTEGVGSELMLLIAAKGSCIASVIQVVVAELQEMAMVVKLRARSWFAGDNGLWQCWCFCCSV